MTLAVKGLLANRRGRLSARPGRRKSSAGPGSSPVGSACAAARSTPSCRGRQRPRCGTCGSSSPGTARMNGRCRPSTSIDAGCGSGAGVPLRRGGLRFRDQPGFAAGGGFPLALPRQRKEASVAGIGQGGAEIGQEHRPQSVATGRGCGGSRSRKRQPAEFLQRHPDVALLLVVGGTRRHEVFEKLFQGVKGDFNGIMTERTFFSDAGKAAVGIDAAAQLLPGNDLPQLLETLPKSRLERRLPPGAGPGKASHPFRQTAEAGPAAAGVVAEENQDAPFVRRVGKDSGAGERVIFRGRREPCSGQEQERAEQAADRGEPRSHRATGGSRAVQPFQAPPPACGNVFQGGRPGGGPA